MLVERGNGPKVQYRKNYWLTTLLVVKQNQSKLITFICFENDKFCYGRKTLRGHWYQWNEKRMRSNSNFPVLDMLPTSKHLGPLWWEYCFIAVYLSWSWRSMKLALLLCYCLLTFFHSQVKDFWLSSRVAHYLW